MLLLGVSLTTAVFATGCGSAAADPPGSASSPSQRDTFLQHEEAVLECMTERGFEYERRSPDDEFSLQVDVRFVDPTYLLRVVEETESLGYALTPGLVEDFKSAAGGEVDVHEGEVAARALALYGSNLQPGCVEVATLRVGSYSVQDAADDFRDEFAAQLADLQSDSSFTDADARVVACMDTYDFELTSSLEVLHHLNALQFKLLSEAMARNGLTTQDAIEAVIAESEDVESAYFGAFKECFRAEETLILGAIDRYFPADE